MNIQWYPGHMTKAKRQMQEDLKLIDVIVELVDARIPYSSKNPDIEELAKNKYRVILLNKADMADEKATATWKNYYEKKGYYVCAINSKVKADMKPVKDIILKACKEKIERNRRKGIINRPMRAMIVGIPNVGKSTFINQFAGKACTKTGNRPGVTKGKQWVRLNKDIELLDTPGILWPKFDEKEVGIRLALIGSIKDEILNTMELSYKLLHYLIEEEKEEIFIRYSIEEKEENELLLLEKIAESRGCRQRGNELDLEKAANIVLDDFRSGKIGRITLEKPEVEN